MSPTPATMLPAGEQTTAVSRGAPGLGYVEGRIQVPGAGSAFEPGVVSVALYHERVRGREIPVRPEAAARSAPGALGVPAAAAGQRASIEALRESAIVSLGAELPSVAVLAEAALGGAGARRCQRARVSWADLVMM